MMLSGVVVGLALNQHCAELAGEFGPEWVAAEEEGLEPAALAEGAELAAAVEVVPAAVEVEAGHLLAAIRASWEETSLEVLKTNIDNKYLLLRITARSCLAYQAGQPVFVPGGAVGESPSVVDVGAGLET